MAEARLRALGVGEMLDVSIKLYLRNAATLLAIVAIVVVPVGVLTILILVSTVPEGARMVDGQPVFPEETGAGGIIGAVVIGGVLGLLATLLATGASFKAIADAYMGSDPSAGASLRFAGRRLLSLVWVSILLVIVAAATFIPAAIPFIGIFLAIALFAYVIVGLSVVIPALLLEDLRGIRAMNRSRELVKGRWWPVAGTVLVGVVIIPLVIQLLVSFLFDLVLVAGMESVTGTFVVSGIGDTIASIITTPLQAAVLTVLYFDLRVRSEGFDLQLLAQAIGTAPAEGPGTPRLSPPPPPDAGGRYPPPPGM